MEKYQGKERVCKTISFKLSDPMEKELLKHAEGFTNFSVYVKRLIQRDKEVGLYTRPQPKPIQNNGAKIIINQKPYNSSSE